MDCATEDLLVYTETEDWWKLLEQVNEADTIIGHNIIDYDIPVLERLLDIVIPKEKVLDTLVLSRLFCTQFADAMGHGLEAWGHRLGIPKIGLDITDWSVFTQEMLARCIQDVHINHRLWNFLNERMKIVISDSDKGGT